jgi:hypothetical protein
VSSNHQDTRTSTAFVCGRLCTSRRHLASACHSPFLLCDGQKIFSPTDVVQVSTSKALLPQLVMQCFAVVPFESPTSGSSALTKSGPAARDPIHAAACSYVRRWALSWEVKVERRNFDERCSNSRDTVSQLPATSLVDFQDHVQQTDVPPSTGCWTPLLAHAVIRVPGLFDGICRPHAARDMRLPGDLRHGSSRRARTSGRGSSPQIGHENENKVWSSSHPRRRRVCKNGSAVGLPLLESWRTSREPSYIACCYS